MLVTDALSAAAVHRERGPRDVSRLYQAPQTLRREATFGPLQAVGAYTIRTIILQRAEAGKTRVLFGETAVAPAGAKLDVPARAATDRIRL